MATQLSERGKALVERAVWRECPKDEPTIRRWIQEADLAVFETIIGLQQRYGGLEYTLRGAQALGMRFNLLDPLGDRAYVVEGSMPEDRPAAEEGDDRVLFVCGDYPGAIHSYLVDQHECLYVSSNATGAPPLPLASSLEVKIESDAMLEQLTSDRGNWHSVRIDALVKGRDFDTLMTTLGIAPIPEASDRYGAWWGDESFLVSRSPLWDPGSPRVTFDASARTPGRLRQFLDRLQS